jgi:ubiquinone/menaquinone biosynthesis C-methylase UbiE
VTDPFSTERIRAAYDVAANDYQSTFGNDLDRLSLDRSMLDDVRRAADGGLILDLGCGTGSAGSYLVRRGARVVGVDISFGMLKAGKHTLPQLSMCQGDMRTLSFRERAFAACVAFYSIHSVTRGELRLVLAELARVLERRGTLLAATHLGEGEVYTHQFLGHDIALTGGTLYSEQEITDQVSSSGFKVESSKARDPLAHEHPSRRIYILATRTY